MAHPPPQDEWRHPGQYSIYGKAMPEYMGVAAILVDACLLSCPSNDMVGSHSANGKQPVMVFEAVFHAVCRNFSGKVRGYWNCPEYRWWRLFLACRQPSPGVFKFSLQNLRIWVIAERKLQASYFITNVLGPSIKLPFLDAPDGYGV